jgi:hypothetical protein
MRNDRGNDRHRQQDGDEPRLVDGNCLGIKVSEVMLLLDRIAQRRNQLNNYNSILRNWLANSPELTDAWAKSPATAGSAATTSCAPIKADCGHAHCASASTCAWSPNASRRRSSAAASAPATTRHNRGTSMATSHKGFKSWLKRQKVTDNAMGDFIGDAKADPDFPSCMAKAQSPTQSKLGDVRGRSGISKGRRARDKGQRA